METGAPAAGKTLLSAGALKTSVFIKKII